MAASIDQTITLLGKGKRSTQACDKVEMVIDVTAFMSVVVYSGTVCLYVDLTVTFCFLKKTSIVDTRKMAKAHYHPLIHPSHPSN